MAAPINSQAIDAALAKPNYIPSGISAAFLEQSRDRPVVIAILFIGSFITLILALRCFARIAVVKQFGLDDWLALGTLVRCRFQRCLSKIRASADPSPSHPSGLSQRCA